PGSRPPQPCPSVWPLNAHPPSAERCPAVVVDGPAGVVGDLPGVAVGVDEHARVAAPGGLGAGAGDAGAGRPGLGEHGVDLGGGADGVGQRHAAPAAAAPDAAVAGAPLAAPPPPPRPSSPPLSVASFWRPHSARMHAGVWKKATWSDSSSTPPSRCQPS